MHNLAQPEVNPDKHAYIESWLWQQRERERRGGGDVWVYKQGGRSLSRNMKNVRTFRYGEAFGEMVIRATLLIGAFLIG